MAKCLLLAQRTSANALHMSAFRGKADISVCRAHVCFRDRYWVERTLLIAAHMSAYDPKMLWGGGEDIASIVADVNRWSAPCRN